MSAQGRTLKPGDFAVTDYEGKGMKRARIVAREDGRRSQTGIMFQVDPPLRWNGPAAWFDADWFEPAPEAK